MVTKRRPSTSDDVPHVMISYQWNVQPLMIKVKDVLKSNGYKIWMDIEHMQGSTLSAMAEAIEQASVVIVAMSQKYKNSQNCRVGECNLSLGVDMSVIQNCPPPTLHIWGT
jgi:male-specific lethal 1